METCAPSADPSQRTASLARAIRALLTKAEPTAVAVIAIMRRRVMLGFCIIQSPSVEPDIAAVMFGWFACRVAAQHIRARNFRERHHATAIPGGEPVGRSTIAEGYRFGRAHAALLPAFDHEERLASVDPVRCARF